MGDSCKHACITFRIFVFMYISFCIQIIQIVEVYFNLMVRNVKIASV